MKIFFWGLTLFFTICCNAETYNVTTANASFYDIDGTFNLKWVEQGEYSYVDHIPPRSFLFSNTPSEPTYAVEQTSFSNIQEGEHLFRVRSCHLELPDYYEPEVEVCWYSGVISIFVGPNTNYHPTYSEIVTSNTNGSAKVYLGNDGILDRPVVIVEPFSLVADSESFEKIYANLNSHGLLDNLKADGYDIIVYKYSNILNGVATAAQGLEVMLKRFNDADYHNISSITIIGMSMGGLVTRYALLDLQRQGLSNKVATWISFDSPHLGARIPQSLANLLRDMHNDLDVSVCNRNSECGKGRAYVRTYIDKLNSKTASELLLNGPQNISAGNVLRNTLYSFGNFPKIPSLGIANGTLTTTQGYPATQARLNVTIARDFPYKDTSHTAWSDPANENLPGSIENFYNDFDSAISDYRKNGGSNKVNATLYSNPAHTFIQPESALLGSQTSSPFTSTIIADNSLVNEHHLEATKTKSDAIFNWIKRYQY